MAKTYTAHDKRVLVDLHPALLLRLNERALNDEDKTSRAALIRKVIRQGLDNEANTQPIIAAQVTA
jgi:metal-responsive CopG/Arc/MetJ family transcriptional regulator